MRGLRFVALTMVLGLNQMTARTFPGTTPNVAADAQGGGQNGSSTGNDGHDSKGGTGHDGGSTGNGGHDPKGNDGHDPKGSDGHNGTSTGKG